MSRPISRLRIFGLGLAPLVVLAATATPLLGCSSTAASGTAPTVKDFTLSPTTLDVAKETSLVGSITVEDVDGDIAGLSAEILLPDGKTQALQDVDVDAGGAKSLPIAIKAAIQPLVAGTYTLHVWARDHAGNASPKLSTVLTAT